MARTIVASNTLQYSDNEISQSNATTYTLIKSINMLSNYSGSMRISFSFASDDDFDETPVYAKIYKNGVAIGTERSTTIWFANGYTTFTEDIGSLTINVNDDIEIYGYATSPFSIRLKDFQISFTESNVIGISIGGKSQLTNNITTQEFYTTGNYVFEKNITLSNNYNGSFRIFYQADSLEGVCFAKIYKNSIVWGSEISLNAPTDYYQTFTDVHLDNGDTIELWLRIPNALYSVVSYKFEIHFLTTADLSGGIILF